ncbi:MAG: peptide deformylase [Clostridiales bacterium]|nr:peptide deformylase [Clostridiales bacterium]
MAVYQIVREGSPVLRDKAKPITKVNDAAIRLLDNLRDTLRATERGVGLAAPQIGISKRAFVVELKDEELYLEIINPELTDFEGSEEGWEGCLSTPGLEGLIPRAAKMKLSYTDREENRCELKAEGYLARVIQHEYDHLEGVLFRDRAVSFHTEEDGDKEPSEGKEGGRGASGENSQGGEA